MFDVVMVAVWCSNRQQEKKDEEEEDEERDLSVISFIKLCSRPNTLQPLMKL